MYAIDRQGNRDRYIDPKVLIILYQHASHNVYRASQRESKDTPV